MDYILTSYTEVRINAEAPEPLPSVVKIIQTFEWPPQFYLAAIGRLLPLASALSEHSIELAVAVFGAIELLYAKLKGYSIGLYRTLSAHGTNTNSASASITIQNPED